MSETVFDPRQYIRSIPNWPKKGVIFRDISSLLENKLVFRRVIDLFIHRHFTTALDAVVGIDARGFIIGAPLAYGLNAGFIPVRKKGKLPGATISQAYALEYGEAEVEIQPDWLHPGDKVVLIDDLIATGGTMLAAVQLLQRLEVRIVEATAIIDLPDLGGSRKLREAGVLANNRHFIAHSQMEYQPNGDGTTEGQALHILGYAHAYLATKDQRFLDAAIWHWEAYEAFFYAGQPIPDMPQRRIANWIVNSKEPVLANWPIDAACGQLAGDVKDRTRVEQRIVLQRKADTALKATDEGVRGS